MRKTWKMVVTPASRSGKKRLHWHVAMTPQRRSRPRSTPSHAPVEDGAVVTGLDPMTPETADWIVSCLIKYHFQHLFRDSKLAHDRQLAQLLSQDLTPLSVTGKLEPKDLH